MKVTLGFLSQTILDNLKDKKASDYKNWGDFAYKNSLGPWINNEDDANDVLNATDIEVAQQMQIYDQLLELKDKIASANLIVANYVLQTLIMQCASLNVKPNDKVTQDNLDKIKQIIQTALDKASADYLNKPFL